MVLKGIDTVYTAKKGVVALLADTEPASLEISGADIEELPDDYVFAAGSTLITPTADYIAFEDGVFTQKYNIAPAEG